MRRSALSNSLRAELGQASRERGSAELTEEALALFEVAVQRIQRDQGLSRAEASEWIARTRRAGRRPSKAAGDP